MNENSAPPSKEEFIDHFGGLITDDTAERLVSRAEGRTMATEKKIADLKGREEVTLVVRVNKINEPKEFKKREGGTGRVRNIGVEDESGTCRLTLWDDDVELPEGLKIQTGTKLKLSNCYTKQTEFGLDISKGKKGSIEVIE